MTYIEGSQLSQDQGRLLVKSNAIKLLSDHVLFPEATNSSRSRSQENRKTRTARLLKRSRVPRLGDKYWLIRSAISPHVEIGAKRKREGRSRDPGSTPKIAVFYDLFLLASIWNPCYLSLFLSGFRQYDQGYDQITIFSPKLGRTEREIYKDSTFFTRKISSKVRSFRNAQLMSACVQKTQDGGSPFAWLFVINKP